MIKMRREQLLLALAILLCLPARSYAQAWAGILLPVSGAGACNSTSTISPGRCGIDWSTAGVPGGIPNRATICATINASSYGNGSTDATSGIQSALNSCPANQVVVLTAGAFLINGNLNIPSNVTLRGAGADTTILNAKGSGGGTVISLGNGGPNLTNWPAKGVTAGASAGSTSITLSDVSGLSVGSLITVEQQNDGTIVSINGGEGTCTWCDYYSNGLDVQGQTTTITAINGKTVTIADPIYVNYTLSPQIIWFPLNNWTQNAGVENLQVYANNTGYVATWAMSGCAYCWISGVEGNYADGNHVNIDWSYRSAVVNSYFSNAYLHTPGTSDSCLGLRSKSTGILVQNNIFERLHVSIMLEWGAAGNVIAYNYSFGAYDFNAPYVTMGDLDYHGAHPQFNLIEGNVMASFYPDGVWGSSANNTFFRNWALGTTKICSPLTQGSRGTVNCSGANGYYAFQAARAFDPAFTTSNYNMVGDVAGSSAQQSLVHLYSPYSTLTSVNEGVALCGPSPCGAGSRGYDDRDYAYTFGYGEASDNGTGGTTGGAGCGSGVTGYACHSITPYSTVLMHGEYSNISNSTIWANGITQTLPTSFYLNSKPSWWGSTPYPAIGPDVAGGSGPGGHTYSIPAQVCYSRVMGGTDGSGSPLTFNASTCYSSNAPSPPTNLTAIPQ